VEVFGSFVHGRVAWRDLFFHPFVFDLRVFTLAVGDLVRGGGFFRILASAVYSVFVPLKHKIKMIKIKK
jgi:hypothetical protein